MPRRTRIRAAAAGMLAAFAGGMTGCTQYYVYGTDPMSTCPPAGGRIIRYGNGQVCEVPTIVDGGVVVMDEPAIGRDAIAQEERPISSRRDPVVSTPRRQIARGGWQRGDIDTNTDPATIVEGGLDQDVVRQ